MDQCSYYILERNFRRVGRRGDRYFAVKTVALAMIGPRALWNCMKAKSGTPPKKFTVHSSLALDC
jgi:hypothetical protein